MESDISDDMKDASNAGRENSGSSGWLKMGAIAAASAALGGLAAAWFYRKTLSRLREAENEIPDPITESTKDAMGEDF